MPSNKRHVNHVLTEYTQSAALHPSPHPFIIPRKPEKKKLKAITEIDCSVTGYKRTVYKYLP